MGPRVPHFIVKAIFNIDVTTFLNESVWNEVKANQFHGPRSELA